jgi:hypothetical protein
MAYSELTHEAITGLRTYKNALLGIHQGYTGAIDVEEIRERLAAEGVVTESPLVNIPYTQHHLEQTAALTEIHPWTDLFTPQRIDDALSKRKMIDDGRQPNKAGFPTAFWSPILDVAVVFDDTDLNAEHFGKTYAFGLGIHYNAHEIAHSAFARICTTRYRKIAADKVKIQCTSGIGQAVDDVTLWEAGGSLNSYQPIWIDEAFAQRMSADVRGAMLPTSVPKVSRVIDIQGYGAGEVEVPQRYLIYSDEHPEHPGASSSVEGVGIDVLVEKRPWLLPQIKAMCVGALPVHEFHQNLLHGVGRELYEGMTQRRPYSAWGGILDEIVELDKS